MDDFVAALLSLPFLILPSIVLFGIISSKIKASELAKKMWGAIAGAHHRRTASSRALL